MEERDLRHRVRWRRGITPHIEYRTSCANAFGPEEGLLHRSVGFHQLPGLRRAAWLNRIGLGLPIATFPQFAVAAFLRMEVAS